MGAIRPAKCPLRATNERRRHGRTRSRILVQYESEGRPSSGYVLDISRGGLCMQTSRVHQKGDLLDMTIKLFPDGPPLRAKAQVIVIRQKDPHRRLLGVRFEPLTPEADQQLAGYLEE